MCGIGGVFNSELSKFDLNEIGRTMIKQLNHRGPDGSGSETIPIASTGKNILLAHSRLSINDLSDSGKQPMSDQTNTCWITFNGEIYNFKQIREELVRSGLHFKSASDTEVLVESYKKWGLKAFDKFVGMWALAIWDSETQRLILSRDRLGIKPLYYCEVGDTVWFGSEPKVITEQVPAVREINLEAISDYFSFRYPLDGNSFYKGVKLLEPGTHLIAQPSSSSKTVQYWDLPVVIDKIDPGEEVALAEVQSLLEESVKFRLISDVPVGSFLSGGLDSSLLVALMKKNHKGSVNTFTTGFADEGFNEFEYARLVSASSGTDHRETLLGFDNYFQSLDEMISVKDAPLAVPNEIALHSLSKALKRHVTVVLSGEGADELFGGYGRIFRSAFDYQRVHEAGVEGLSGPLKKNLQAKYGPIEFGSQIDHFLSQYSYIDMMDKDELLTKKAANHEGFKLNRLEYFENQWSKLEGLDLAEKYMWIFQKVHLPGLLGRLDSATMSASVEGRVPFVDHRLVEYVNALPMKYKMKWKTLKLQKEAKNLNSDQISENYDVTKYLLRECSKKHLPETIINRKKVGFPVPLQNWFSGPMKSHAKDVLLSRDAKSRNIFSRKKVKDLLKNIEANNQNGMTVWMLINVERWMEKNRLSI